MKHANKKNRICIFFVLPILFLIIGIAQNALGAEDSRSVQKTVRRDNPKDLEDNHFSLEISPCYYKYKTDSPAMYNLGLLFKADVGPGWEISVGSDFITYQNPDSGLSDLFLGAKYNFYDRDGLTMAFTGNILFPTGNEAFREPGIEPTLAFLISRKLGDWEIGLTVGSTYQADEDGEPNYLDLEVSLELDYRLDEKNSFGVSVSGYGPDERIGGSTRFETGMSYTRELTPNQSLGIILEKGFSGKKLDWSGTLVYNYTF